MDINPAISPGLSARPLDAAALRLEFRVGQLLEAVVLSRPAASKALLLIEGTKLPVETRVALQTGQHLSLTVERSAPTVVLRINPGPPDARTVRSSVLLQALPRQLPIAETLTRVAAALRDPAAPLPAPVRDSANAVLAGAPRVEALTRPAPLRETVLRSGVFLEPRLTRALPPGTAAPAWVGTDLKALLLRLHGALLASSHTISSSAPPAAPNSGAGRAPGQQQVVPVPMPAGRADGTTPRSPVTPRADAPPESERHTAPERLTQLTRQVEGALARIQLNQLGSSPHTDGTTERWQIEIPVFALGRFHTLGIEVERDGERDTPGRTRTWTVSLSVDLGDLGPLHARLLLNGRSLSTTLWAENPDTAILVGRHLGALEDALSQNGLEVGSIRCCEGRPAATSAARPRSGPLLQVRA